MAAPGPGMPNGVGRTGGITEEIDDPLSPSMRSKLRAASSFLGETNGEASKPTPKPRPKLKYAFLERPERKLAFPNRLQEHFLQVGVLCRRPWVLSRARGQNSGRGCG